MFSLVKTWRTLKKEGVMGVNQRNGDYVLWHNKRQFYPYVDDKILTKERAIAYGMNVPEQYGVITSESEIKRLSSILGGRQEFVIKPAQGAGGDGILVVADQFDKTRYKTASGRMITLDEIEYQISSILTGLYSLGGMRDRALIEYKVNSDPLFEKISYEGVPDVRVIVLEGYPVMAMVRLPTRQSDGKANLHQGAIGVGVDLQTGQTLHGVWFNDIIYRHPDTNNPVSEVTLPDWQGFLELATGCFEVSKLGYIGVDMVLDKDQGPLILEINARPGLNIQIANNAGLAKRTKEVEAHLLALKKKGVTEPETIQERVAFSRSHFGA